MTSSKADEAVIPSWSLQCRGWTGAGSPTGTGTDVSCLSSNPTVNGFHVRLRMSNLVNNWWYFSSYTSLSSGFRQPPLPLVSRLRDRAVSVLEPLIGGICMGLDVFSVCPPLSLQLGSLGGSLVWMSFSPIRVRMESDRERCLSWRPSFGTHLWMLTAARLSPSVFPPDYLSVEGDREYSPLGMEHCCIFLLLQE